MSISLRFCAAVISASLLNAGCAYTLTGGSRLNPYDEDLRPLVGKTLTLDGGFWLNGKVGPYIERHSTLVYLVPHSPFSWGSDYEHMQGKVVKITGTLHFQHFERVPTGESTNRPADYYYFDAETAKIRLKKP